MEGVTNDRREGLHILRKVYSQRLSSRISEQNGFNRNRRRPHIFFLIIFIYATSIDTRTERQLHSGFEMGEVKEANGQSNPTEQLRKDTNVSKAMVIGMVPYLGN